MARGYYLDGDEVKGKAVYEVVNPHTNEVIAQVADCTEEEMTAAIASSHQAFQTMKKMPAHKRADILYRAAALMKERGDEFARLITAEAGKPISASRSEVERSVQTLQFAAEEAKQVAGSFIPMDAAKGGEGRDAYTIYEPIGVIGAVTPFNFPLNLTVHKVGPAIAAGNTIVVKPAEKTPLSCLLLAEIMTEAGLPAGALNIVPGEGPKLVPVLLHDGRVQKISFTGSPAVGQEVKSKAGLKRVTLELGSNSALYVDASSEARLEDITAKAVTGAFSYNGQVCIHTQRVYVHEAIADSFIDKFVQKTKLVKFGDPLAEDTVVTGMINEKAQQRVLNWIEEAVSGGAELLCGGRARETGVEPTVLTNVKPEDKVVCQEIFGPVVIIQRVRNGEEALRLMNDSDYGLNAGVFTENLPQALKFAHELEVGQVLINDVPTLRFDHMPYGGVKQSGYGYEGVKYAIREMTRMKMISLNYQY